MIDPRRYNTWPRELERLAQELEDYILRDIARRLKKAGSITATAENQIARLIEQGKSAEAIQKEISRVSGIHQKKIEGLYEKAARESQRFDAEVFRKLGKEAPALRNNQYLQTVIRAQSRQTQGEFVNMTQSLGFMLVERGRLVFTPLATAYQRALDLAVEKVLSGAVSQDRAVKDAVKALADSGVRTADYAGGHTDQLDVAVQRAVRTGMNQISARVTDANLDEQQSPLVEVSAHAGARDKGDDFKNHKLWQGKVYYWRQRDRWNRGDLADKYPDFVDSTGYGDVAGLEGANCRHSYRVFIEGVSKRMYTDEELANIDGPPVQYKGKTYTAYEATQRQRQLERTMRKYKRELLAYEAAGIGPEDEDYQAAAIRLQSYSREYKAFSAAAHLTPQTERAQVAGFGRSEAARALATYRRVESFREALTGTRTNTGVLVREVALHLTARAAQRGVEQESIVDALTSPLKTGSIRADGSQQFIGERATVSVNVETGKIITVWPTSTKKAERFKGGK